MSVKSRAYTAAILVAIIIGLSFMFVKISLEFATPLDALAHRFSIAFAGMTLFMTSAGISLGTVRPDIKKIVFLAAFYPVMFFGFQAFGMQTVSSAEAGIIQAAVPVFTLLLSALWLKESSSLKQKLAIGLSVLGVVYIMLMNGAGGSGFLLAGIMLILLSVMSQSVYQVLTRKLTRNVSVLLITYVSTLVGFLVFNAASLTQHVFNGTITAYFQPFSHADYTFATLNLGILSTLFTSYLTAYALSVLPAFQMSVFGNLTIVITMAAGMIFLQEPLYGYHYIGALMIILGVIGANTSRLKNADIRTHSK
ncbi:DMT family transporter [Jeotgalibacillus aurantiacus]|uniref:DMT family transporter n=1 Tax=Jeotgalibacillus aurantiacus TaxID=2763266 RepID=UPI001D0BD93A|nr:DMT family transporter [Jeotgalibacillus aurantiacus]